jgi:membrane fusion protein (multidrug efflux system)
MAEARSVVTAVSLAVAIVAGGWAMYVSRHAGRGDAGGVAPPAAATARTPKGAADAGSGGGAGAAAGGGAATPVVSAEVREEELARELKALGTAVANESVDVTSKTSNVVSAVHFRDGQTVTRGYVLVELDSAQARADLAVAEAAFTESTSLYNRSRELMVTQALSKSQFDQVESTNKANAARVGAARAKLEDTIIRAPFAGRVGLRRVSLGSLVNPGTVIATLDDTTIIKVDFAVPENALASLHPGQAISAFSAAYPGMRIEGKVVSVDSRVDPITRSVTVRAHVPNDKGLVKPGMFLTVELTRDQRSALVVPEEALVPEQDRQYVYVVEGGKAIKREVQIGARRPGSVEVVAGLNRGERVIVEGTVKVRAGGAVRDLAVGAASTSKGVAQAAAR